MTFNSHVFLQTLTEEPGVYQMFGADEEVLYVGKAKNLKKRLTQYFQTHRLDPKTKSLMEQVRRIEVTVTAESDALLLECTLIKRLQPKYNILLRDGKGYPFIYISTEDPFPRLEFYRGKKDLPGRYFGPYTSSYAVRETLNLLQKLFRIRSCQDTFFRARTRPCLQHQMHRCTAPCVELITKEEYKDHIAQAILFLEGRSDVVIDQLTKRMEKHGEKLEFEQAAELRDQIQLLKKIQEKQSVSNKHGNTDVIAVVRKFEWVCVHVITIRQGNVVNSRSYFPAIPPEATHEEVLLGFISQYYVSTASLHDIPDTILVNHPFEDSDWVARTLSAYRGKRVVINHKGRVERAQWLAMAIKSAEQSAQQRAHMHLQSWERWDSLSEWIGVAPLTRVECFDISHTLGEATVASCVVFVEGRPLKSAYRKFNIENITKGDDYAAMHQALMRRFKKAKEDPNSVLPELLIIDGGKGQLRQAEEVLESLGLKNNIMLLAVAKGQERKSGWETFWISGEDTPRPLDSHHPAFHLIQHIRDESHRFAITVHRKKRQKARTFSVLEQIPGIGPKRRRALLKTFEGLDALRKASIEEIAQVEGMNSALAEKVFLYLASY